MSGESERRDSHLDDEPRGLFATIVASLGLLSAGALAGLVLLGIFLTAATIALAILLFVGIGAYFG
ncbi:MAG: hypothetical protein EA397_18900 [Deltaproteobacteria bacterium]|nr:MAG: hypothetical protein EA397_18900 [Deltaproteobacteria bacterium]